MEFDNVDLIRITRNLGMHVLPFLDMNIAIKQRIYEVPRSLFQEHLQNIIETDPFVRTHIPEHLFQTFP